MRIENILVIMRADEGQLARLQAAAPDAKVIRQSVKTLTPQQVAEADVVVGNLPPNFFPHLKRIKLLQLNSAGVAPHYVALGQNTPGMVLCCASGAYGVAISEHMLGALLMLMKRLHQYRDDQHQAQWEDRGDVAGLRGAQVLSVGMGDIGTRFAQLCACFGAQVIGIRRRPAAPPEGVQRIATMDELDSLLPQADVVALSLPETEDTMGLMDARRFGLMKQGSYLLNVGRGSAVVQPALLEALRSGWLAGAAIDVTEPEPLPKDDPLWQEPNLLITPHISGQYHLRLTHDNIIDMAARNIRALLGEGEYVARVDLEAGYRA